jgi:DNA-binding NarL/FixJ family response regulator
MSKSGIRKIEPSSDVIPIEVAALGQPYIAAYLYAAHGLSIEEIADDLNIEQSSVSQYLSDVANQHR